MASVLNRAERLRAYIEAVQLAVSSVPEEVHQRFVRGIVASDQIVVAGRGRSGMMGSAFARRLGQMGLRVWGLDDTTVPRLGPGDTLVACTGSGETPTVLSLMRTARSGGAKVLAVTRSPALSGLTADVVVELPVPPGGAVYPLGTLFEASLLAYLDQVVVDLLTALGATESELGARHTNLE
ncbi:MAG: SIS domain-containing protein [Planctomycetota bacterium]